MEAFVWAATDADLGVCISSRAFGSLKDAVDDAQESIGDAFPITWRTPGGIEVDAAQADDIAEDELLGDFTDSEGNEGHVAVSPVKVRL